jgi:hypothetical protein
MSRAEIGDRGKQRPEVNRIVIFGLELGWLQAYADQLEGKKT